MTLAGHRRLQPASEQLVVDYADVLRQAVENERWRVLREVRQRIARIQTSKYRSGSYRSDDRNPTEVKQEALDAVDAVENQP